MMDLIGRSYTHLERQYFRCLFNSLVSSNLEHSVSIWYSLLKKDEELMENVLRQARKLIPGIHDKTIRNAWQLKFPA